jgi:glycosyltransferase involved in cell wall biosynthesis
MRTRDKLASYQVLAEAFGLLRHKAWRALLVGDGPARAEIERLMAPFGERVRFAGAVPHAELPKVYTAADLYLWPAINEAYGMAFLEAQAAGLPVVAGRTGGVPAVVADGIAGILTPVGDAAGFAAAVARLLDNPDERTRLSEGAAGRVAVHHDERAAGHALAAGLALLR